MYSLVQHLVRTNVLLPNALIAGRLPLMPLQPQDISNGAHLQDIIPFARLEAE